MRKYAEVVVIGGGVLGSSVGLHLLREGQKDVLVLERDGPGQGTSAAAAGMLGTLAAGHYDRFGAEELAAEIYGLDHYAQLAETHTISYRQGGNLWLARSEAAWEQLSPLVTHDAIPDKRVVDQQEIGDLCGGAVNTNAVIRGLFHPNGAQLSAGDAARAIASQFRMEGGDYQERTPVHALIFKGDRVVGVRSLWGEIGAGVVILAAGAWSNVLLSRHGLFLAMVPRLASRQITDPQGIPRDIPGIFLAGWAPDGRQFVWIREERAGLLWGMRYDCYPRDAYVDSAPPERFDQINLSGVSFVREQVAPLAAEAVPGLLHPSFTVAHGAPCYTVDGRALVGRVPGAENVYAITGDNENGILNGPGWSLALAQLIMHGESRLTDVRVWDPGRFGETYKTQQAVLDALLPWRAAIAMS